MCKLQVWICQKLNNYLAQMKTHDKYEKQGHVRTCSLHMFKQENQACWVGVLIVLCKARFLLVSSWDRMISGPSFAQNLKCCSCYIQRLWTSGSFACFNDFKHGGLLLSNYTASTNPLFFFWPLLTLLVRVHIAFKLTCHFSLPLWLWLHHTQRCHVHLLKTVTMPWFVGLDCVFNILWIVK